jgi:hypothetical protein
LAKVGLDKGCHGDGVADEVEDGRH